MVTAQLWAFVGLFIAIVIVSTIINLYRQKLKNEKKYQRPEKRSRLKNKKRFF